jgi:hypothetical protein
MRLKIIYQGQTYITKKFIKDIDDLNNYTLFDLTNYIVNNILKRNNLDTISLNLEDGSILIMCKEAINRCVFIVEKGEK